MNGSATRLTLYALISAIEADLRTHLASILAGQQNLQQTLGSELYTKAFERLQKEQGVSAYITELKDLLPFFDFSDSLQLLNSFSAKLHADIRQSLALNADALSSVVHVRNRVMHARPLLHDDFPKIHDLSEKLASLITTWPNLAQAFCTIKDNPSSVLTGNIPDVDEGQRNHNLPIPDFDETGFLGRDNQAKQLLNLLQGPYPVISVIGEGGIGKTALALKVAYDVLDDSNFTFDSIVWATAKGSTLSPREIVNIEGAIKDSLGIFTAVSTQLSGLPTTNAMGEVLSYLTEFRILLILDNLETVIDASIREFLESLPNGSKVLITSRIGLGDFERRVKLDRLDERDAAYLLRTLAKLRGVDSLAKTPEDQLRNYVKRMKCNPGYIKWFVAAVQAGRRPEDVLLNPSLFLDYCLSHVHEYLCPEAKRLLGVLQTIPRHLSLAELAYYVNMETAPLNSAVQQLLSTNMVSMVSMKAGPSGETQYALSELAREYLLKKQPLLAEDAHILHDLDNRLRLASTETSGSSKANPYSIYTVDASTVGERIAARYLLDALHLTNRHDYSTARDKVNRAKDLSPHFYEVHRVEAFLNALTGNLDEARQCYDHAVTLAPNSARLRVWYGGFLLRYMQDPEGALREFREASKLAPTAPDHRLEIARAHFQMHQFDAAELELTGIAKSPYLVGLIKRKYWDTLLQLHQRKADFCLRSHDTVICVSALEKLADLYEDCPVYIRDRHVADTLDRAAVSAQRCLSLVIDKAERERVEAILERLRTEQEGLFYDTAVQSTTQRYRGIVTSLSHNGQRFGFVTPDKEKELFFHFSAVMNLARNQVPRINANMTFDIGMNANGRCAVNCRLED